MTRRRRPGRCATCCACSALPIRLWRSCRRCIPSVISFWLLNPESVPTGVGGATAVPCSPAPPPASSGAPSRRNRAAAATSDGTAPTATPTGRSGAVHGRSDVLGDRRQAFQSGSGIAHRMITTAVPDGEDSADDLRARRRAGGRGTAPRVSTLIAEWDGMGMAATQSHAMRLDRAPGVRLGPSGPARATSPTGAGAFVATAFTAVILGVLDEAVAVAKRQLAPKAEELRAYERGRVGAGYQRPLAGRCRPYEGSLRAMEAGRSGRPVRRTAARRRRSAELAEAVLAAAHEGDRWRRVLATQPVRPLVRGRSRSWLPTSAMGSRLRQPLRHVVRLITTTPDVGGAVDRLSGPKT